MVADGLATWGARASAAIVLFLVSWILFRPQYHKNWSVDWASVRWSLWSSLLNIYWSSVIRSYADFFIVNCYQLPKLDHDIRCYTRECYMVLTLHVAISLNSLGPSDAIWHWISWSTLVQVMACCLTAPSHYMNQCWLIISKVLWHSSGDIIIRRFEDTNQ